MYRRGFSLFVRAAACALVAIATIQQAAPAAEPETQTVTFAIQVSVGLPAGLSEFVGEDTVGIHFGKWAGTTGTLTFASDSPACEGFEVADTSWSQQSFDRVTILNKGGPIVASKVHTLVGPIPPEHSVLLISDITDVRACWIKENDSSQAYVQESFDDYTVAAIFIVTAEFRVRN